MQKKKPRKKQLKLQKLLPGLLLESRKMSNWFERKAEDWFGTPEKKMRLLQWLVYVTNLYIIFGIFVLIWILYGKYIIQAWDYYIK
ncbi:MAG: hypothetical protein QUS07_04255, partial [Methanothrix sp.]|nr:hypothetical protein [Methanothrix sp.]